MSINKYKSRFYLEIGVWVQRGFGFCLIGVFERFFGFWRDLRMGFGCFGFRIRFFYLNVFENWVFLFCEEGLE